MKISIDVIELIDLQSALRRAKHYTNDALEWSKKENMTKSIKVYERDFQKYEELIQKLEAAFDAAYPPPAKKDDAA